jgi:hypothetical protein
MEILDMPQVRRRRDADVRVQGGRAVRGYLHVVRRGHVLAADAVGIILSSLWAHSDPGDCVPAVHVPAGALGVGALRRDERSALLLPAQAGLKHAAGWLSH